MTIYDFIAVTSDSQDVNIYDFITLELLAQYDGKNSIPHGFNGVDVLNVDAEHGIINLYV